ncbi:MAG: hypothetical protein JXA13_17435 [Anaerolineales bacterium]|nr:hypothetical protein [Anaerolineales bacterium]
MRLNPEIEGFESQNIEVDFGMWTGSKLLVNGQPAPKGSKRGEMLLTKDDGQQVAAAWKPQMLGLDVPQLSVEGRNIQMVEPLKWYQAVWGGLPVLLVFAGGLLGALAGVIAFTINAGVFRMKMNEVLKYAATGAISAAAGLVYFVLALLVSSMVG